MKGLKKLFLGIMMLLMGVVVFGVEMDLLKVILKDLNGMSYFFGKDGKLIYVKFWVFWCLICFFGLEDIDNFSKEKKDFEVVIVVFFGLVGEKKIEDFKKWYKFLEYKNIKVLLDEKGELLKMLNVCVYLIFVVVNKVGKVEKVFLGYLEKVEIKKLFFFKMNDVYMMKDDKMMMNDKGMKDIMMKDDKMMNDKYMMKDDKMNMEKKILM